MARWIDLVCDGCGLNIFGYRPNKENTDSWRKMLARAKKAGWVEKRGNGIAEHYCSSCADDMGSKDGQA